MSLAAVPSAEALIAGLFGLLIGSFLNVCIYRWPRDLSVISPRSKCTACEKPVRAFDNIPVLSFLLLRGRCRDCGAAISWRYPAVELLTAISFVYFVAVFGLGATAAKYCFFFCLLIGLVFSDLETLLLPDQFTLGGLGIGLVAAFFIRVPDSTFHILSGLAGLQLGERFTNAGEALLGAFLPAAAIWLGGWIFEKLRHKEGLGFGDVKMIAMVGAFLGLSGSLLTIVLGSLLGSVIGLTFIVAKKKNAGDYQLPFAAFLGLGAFLATLRGQAMLSWYERTMWGGQ